MAVQIVVVVAQAAPEPARRALGDARVRRAILLALDRARYVSHVYRGNATVASQYVHPVVFGYDPAIQALAYDPGEARRLLVEAGFGGGFEVELAHGGQNRGVVAEIVADLKKVGIRVKPVPLGLGELIAAGHAHRYALLYYARTCTTADASEFLDSSMHTEDAARGLGGENFALYSCREVDSLLDAAEGELATQSRGLLLQRAQRRVLEDLPILPLTVWWDDLGVSSRLDVVTRHDAWLWIAGFHWRH